MSSKPYDELPWWCQLLRPWFGPPWYEQAGDLDAYLDAFRRALTLQAGELAGELAGDDQPGEGYLARAGRLIAARHQAEELIRHQYGPLRPDDEDDGDEDPCPGLSPGTPARHRAGPSLMGGGGYRTARTARRFRVRRHSARVRVRRRTWCPAGPAG